MNNNTYELLKQIADKLGTTVEYLWPRLLGHVKMQALIQGIGGILMILSSIALYKLGRFFWSKKTGHWLDDDGWNIGAVFTYITGAVMIVIGICVALSAIPDYFYPELPALKMIVGK
jgi:hypothetical protein